MTDTHDATRRGLLTRGSMVLGAALGAAAAAPPSLATEHEALRNQLQEARDREGLRVLQEQLLQQLATTAPQRLGIAHAGAWQLQTPGATLMLQSSAGRAQLQLPVSTELCLPIEGDGSIEQMARLQGNVASRRALHGTLEMHCERQDGRWSIAALRFAPAADAVT